MMSFVFLLWLARVYESRLRKKQQNWIIYTFSWALNFLWINEIVKYNFPVFQPLPRLTFTAIFMAKEYLVKITQPNDCPYIISGTRCDWLIKWLNMFINTLVRFSYFQDTKCLIYATKLVGIHTYVFGVTLSSMAAKCDVTP